MYVNFLLFASVVLLAFALMALVAEERTERKVMVLLFNAAMRVSEWAIKIDADAYEAAHTSDWTPGRLGTKWLRFVIWLDTKAYRVSGFAHKRISVLDHLDNSGSFVEAD